jgi:hypothetical protein
VWFFVAWRRLGAILPRAWRPHVFGCESPRAHAEARRAALLLRLLLLLGRRLFNMFNIATLQLNMGPGWFTSF